MLRVEIEELSLVEGGVEGLSHSHGAVFWPPESLNVYSLVEVGAARVRPEGFKVRLPAYALQEMDHFGEAEVDRK